MEKWMLTLLIISLLLPWASGFMPEDRLIDWTMVGVDGGIPQRSVLRDCVAMDGVHPDGSDTSQEIQACIDNVPQNGVAYLPAGTYTLSSGIKLKSQKTLRGAGADKTILAAGDMRAVVYIGEQYSPKAAIDIISGYNKGSSQLTLADAALVNVGAYIRIDELNDASVPVTNVGYGTCTWCGRDNGARVRTQLTKVTAKSGNTITIDPPMYFTFKRANKPQVLKVGAPTTSGMVTEFAGIEALTIRNVGTSMNNYRIPIEAYLSANCWAKGIRIENCGQRCIQLYYDNFGFELRDSTISRCISDRYDSNDCYGMLIGIATSNILIENNIYEYLADGPMFGWGASGNVIGYNFIYDAHRTNVMKTWFIAIGGSHHGAHTSYNLWEGNVMEALYFDQYWGSGSHNTAFRNRIIGKYMDDSIADPYINSVYTVGTEKNLHHQSYLGNVLGTDGYHNYYEEKSGDCSHKSDRLIYTTGRPSSGTDICEAGPFNTMFRHMNYDYVTKTVKKCSDAGEPGCQGISPATTIPASLYRQSKPVWFGSVAWPAIGPDVSGYAMKIPAQLRFEGQPPVCTPSCSGRQCGSDGCGGSCGTCQSGACVNGVCQQSSSGLEIEAEQAQLSGSMQILSDSQASGGLYVAATIDNQGSVRFTFDVAEGTYLLQARVNSLGSSGTDSFFVGLDNEPANGDSYYMYSLPLDNGYAWDNVSRWGTAAVRPAEFDPMVFLLSSGTHTFTFYARESGTRLDVVRLIKFGNAVHEADTDSDGCVRQDELMQYIAKWKSGQVTLANLMEAIGIWKNGC
jgi:hypothetical protein